MVSNNLCDKFWLLPAESFSARDFIHCVRNVESSTPSHLLFQEFSDAIQVKAQCNHTTLANSACAEAFISSHASILKNSGSATLDACQRSERNHQLCDVEKFCHFSGFSEFDNLLLTKWEEASTAGALNYDVDKIITKILPGKHGIVAQLNPARAVKRRRPQPFSRIDEPFNAETFNFTKVKSQELLFNIKLSLSSGEELDGSVIVNAAPICSSHSLILPSVASSQPQVINKEGLLLAVSTVFLSNLRSYCVGFNSLCAYASVNHHHYHCYYLPQKICVETAACHHVHGSCYVFTDHYAPGFVFQADPDCITDCVREVMKLLTWLVAASVPHNVFITRGLPLSMTRGVDDPGLMTADDNLCERATEENRTSREGEESIAVSYDGPAAVPGRHTEYSAVRVCVWARQSTYGAKDVSVFAPALCELAGHVPVYDSDAWDHLNEKYITNEIHAVCKDAFNYVLSNIKSIL